MTKLTREQAYHAYTTHAEAVGNPTISFDSFDDNYLATWQKVGDAFYSFIAVPDASEGAAVEAGVSEDAPAETCAATQQAA